MTKFAAVTGMNLGPDGARYEAGEVIPSTFVEPWMLGDANNDDAIVEIVSESTGKKKTASAASTAPALSTGAPASTSSTSTGGN